MDRSQLDRAFGSLVSPELLTLLEEFCNTNSDSKFDRVTETEGKGGFWYVQGYRAGQKAVLSRLLQARDKVLSKAP